MQQSSHPSTFPSKQEKLPYNKIHKQTETHLIALAIVEPVFTTAAAKAFPSRRNGIAARAENTGQL